MRFVQRGFLYVIIAFWCYTIDIEERNFFLRDVGRVGKGRVYLS